MGKIQTLKSVITNIDKRKKKKEEDDDGMMGDPKKHKQMRKNMHNVKKEGCE